MEDLDLKQYRNKHIRLEAGKQFRVFVAEEIRMEDLGLKQYRNKQIWSEAGKQFWMFVAEEVQIEDFLSKETLKWFDKDTSRI